MKKVVSILLIILLCVSLTGCGELDIPQKDDDSSGDDYIDSTLILSEKIVVESFDNNGNILIIMENENEIDIYLVVGIEFYKNNQLVDEIGGTGFFVAKSTQVGHTVNVSDKEYDDYKVILLLVKDIKEMNREMHTDKVQLVSHLKRNDGIFEVVLKNNYDKTLENIFATIIFYQSDKVIGIENNWRDDINAGENAELVFVYPISAITGKTLEFDRYEIHYQGYLRTDLQ